MNTQLQHSFRLIHLIRWSIIVLSMNSCNQENPEPAKPSALFTFIITSNGGVEFSNSSQNASSYVWTFGDGATSIETSPSHSYVLNGAYEVSLKASGSGGVDTSTKSISITNSFGGSTWTYASGVVSECTNPANNVPLTICTSSCSALSTLAFTPTTLTYGVGGPGATSIVYGYRVIGTHIILSFAGVEIPEGPESYQIVVTGSTLTWTSYNSTTDCVSVLAYAKN